MPRLKCRPWFPKGACTSRRLKKTGPSRWRSTATCSRSYNRGPNDQMMTVHGQPGHVSNRGSNIEGSRIVFDRAKNTSDVNGRRSAPASRQTVDRAGTARADDPL